MSDTPPEVLRLRDAILKALGATRRAEKMWREVLAGRASEDAHEAAEAEAVHAQELMWSVLYGEVEPLIDRETVH